jgi:hypothetical protein
VDPPSVSAAAVDSVVLVDPPVPFTEVEGWLSTLDGEPSELVVDGSLVVVGSSVVTDEAGAVVAVVSVDGVVSVVDVSSEVGGLVGAVVTGCVVDGVVDVVVDVGRGTVEVGATVVEVAHGASHQKVDDVLDDWGTVVELTVVRVVVVVVVSASVDDVEGLVVDDDELLDDEPGIVVDDGPGATTRGDVVDEVELLVAPGTAGAGPGATEELPPTPNRALPGLLSASSGVGTSPSTPPPGSAAASCTGPAASPSTRADAAPVSPLTWVTTDSPLRLCKTTAMRHSATSEPPAPTSQRVGSAPRPQG